MTWHAIVQDVKKRHDAQLATIRATYRATNDGRGLYLQAVGADQLYTHALQVPDVEAVIKALTGQEGDPKQCRPQQLAAAFLVTADHIVSALKHRGASLQDIIQANHNMTAAPHLLRGALQAYEELEEALRVD